MSEITLTKAGEQWLLVRLAYEYHLLNDAGRSAEAKRLLPLIERLGKLTAPRKGRGRPPRPIRLSGGPSRLSNLYRADFRSTLGASELASLIRAFADRQGTGFEQVAGWSRGIAQAAENGDAVQAAHCALFALEEMASVIAGDLMPLVRLGQRKRDSDVRRGRRTNKK